MNDERVMLEELYEAYFPKVYNYLFYHLLHKEETEDLTEQVFLKIAEHIDSYDPGKAKPSTWIHSIAANTLTDYYRTRKRCVSLCDGEYDLENELMVDFEEQYNQILEPKRRAVFEALAKMGERDRMMIYCVYFLGMSYREISEQMQIKESTLASALLRAKQKLRKRLEMDGFK